MELRIFTTVTTFLWILPLKDISAQKIAGTERNSYAICADGRLMAWGDNHIGQLGDSTWDNSSKPVKVGLNKVKAVTSTISQHAAALKHDGTVWAWGNNNLGSVDWSGASKNYPVKVRNLENITAISAGNYYTLALKKDGTIWSWGCCGHYGVLGYEPVYPYSPQSIPGFGNVVSISAGGLHALAVKDDSTVWSWGYNNLGQLGDGSVDKRYSPRQILGISEVIAVSGGMWGSLALKKDSTVWMWGHKSFVPEQISGLNRIVAIEAGNYYDDTEKVMGTKNLALRDDGTVWEFTHRDNPKQVLGLEQITDIAIGEYHYLALRQNGSVWSWDDCNWPYHCSYGQLGDEAGNGSIAGLCLIRSAGNAFSPQPDYAEPQTNPDGKPTANFFPGIIGENYLFELTEDSHIFIYTLPGALVYQDAFKKGKNQVHIPDLAKGIYIMVVLQETQKQVFKLMKN